MTRIERHRITGRAAIVLAVAVLLTAAAGAASETGRDVSVARDVSPRPDFSGHWEKSFARSDHWEVELRRAIQQVHQQAQLRHSRGDGNPMAISQARREARALLAKGRLAEMLTRPEALEIVQEEAQIHIERQGDAPLICGTGEERQTVFDTVHGSETCHWVRDHLVFEIGLAEGVTIHHRFIVDDAGEQLRMDTRVSSRHSRPFELRQYFSRHDEPRGRLTCVQTLTQGRVCSTESGAGP